MRLRCSALLALTMLPCPSRAAGDHLVSPQQVDAALAEAAAGRRRDIASLERVLSTPAAEQAAARAGVDLERVRRGLPVLTSDEARELAARAEALDADPVAGILGTLTDLVFLVLLVLLVILVAREV